VTFGGSNVDSVVETKMKPSVCILWVIAAIISGIMLLGCNPGTEDQDSLAPLVVDKESPLLLEEPSGPQETTRTAADAENAACFVCHENYREEPLAKSHAGKNVSCTQCHGKSYPHRNDENHATPPDRMFPVTAIVKLCTSCHTDESISAETEQRVRKDQPDKPASEPVVCTDCHGTHRLKTRTMRWNKETGALITD
jgi:hypothetical protein